jgi:glycosyltransferase involved in cell wall biosynthesis
MRYTYVVTSFNSAGTIETVLKNVMGQEIQPSEVIIIDDASEDDSPNIIQDLISMRSEYRLIQNKTNQGQSYSRNLGVRLASSDFVVFQDDDDISLPNRATCHLESFKLGADFSYLSSRKKYPNGYIVTNKNSDFLSDELLKVHLIRHFSNGGPLPQDLKLFSPSSTLAVRKLFFESIGGFREEMRRLEDIELACRALAIKGILCWSSEIGVERLHTVGSDKTSIANYLGELQVISSVRRYLSPREYFVAQKMILLREAYFSRNLKKVISRGFYLPIILGLSPQKLISILKRIMHDLRQRK